MGSCRGLLLGCVLLFVAPAVAQQGEGRTPRTFTRRLSAFRRPSVTSMPSWHPRHARRAAQLNTLLGPGRNLPPQPPVDPATRSPLPSSTAPPPSTPSPLHSSTPDINHLSLPPNQGTWAKCERCEEGQCWLGTEPPPNATGQCAPCTGCTHQLEAVTGTMDFKGVQYKWEAGSSAAHILRVQQPHPSNGLKPFVKFLCVPSTPKHGVTNCNVGALNATAEALLALQRLSEDCGLDHVSVNGYVEFVQSTLPDQPKNPATPFIKGGGKVSQLGLFTTAAPGISISNLAFTNAKNVDMVTRVKHDQVLDAALFDFLFCCSDRHAQNIFIDEDSNLKLIDNDLMLGGAQKGRHHDGSCSPSSLFLPNNMESWRVRNNAHSKLSHLDYRCHLPMGHTDINFDGNTKLNQCIKQLSESSVEAIQRQYGIKVPKAAQLLKERAHNLRSHGFSKALELTLEEEKRRFETTPECPDNEEERRKIRGPCKPKGESVKHWHINTWRPTEPPQCRHP